MRGFFSGKTKQDRQSKTNQPIGTVDVHVEAGPFTFHGVSMLFGEVLLNADNPENLMMEPDIDLLRRNVQVALRDLADTMDDGGPAEELLRKTKEDHDNGHQ